MATIFVVALAKEDPEAVAQPPVFLLQVPGPPETTGAKSEQKGERPQGFRYGDAHQQKDRIHTAEKLVDHQKDTIEQTGAAVGRSKNPSHVIEQSGETVAQHQGHHFQNQDREHGRHANPNTQREADGRTQCAETAAVIVVVVAAGIFFVVRCCCRCCCCMLRRTSPVVVVVAVVVVVVVIVVAIWYCQYRDDRVFGIVWYRNRDRHGNVDVLDLSIQGPPWISFRFDLRGVENNKVFQRQQLFCECFQGETSRSKTRVL